MSAIDEGHLALKKKDAGGAILGGYQESMGEGGRPFVLEEENTWLRRIAVNKLRDPVHFGQKLGSLLRFDGRVPPAAKQALGCLWPEPDLSRSCAAAVSLVRQPKPSCPRLSIGPSKRKPPPGCSMKGS
jgi:hypothetical protein